MKKRLTQDEKLRSLPQPVPCRWKHLRGEERKALFRATCGQGQCRGHLGDLRFQESYEEQARDVLEEIQRDRRRAEQRLARGEDPTKGARSAEDELARLASREERAQRHLVEATADERAGRVQANQEWRMFAIPVLGQFIYANEYYPPHYSGYADTGYRLSFGRKRSRNGNEIGRRPFYPAHQQSPSWMNEIYGTGRYALLGQRFGPPALIWCPISTCEALNSVDWPEALQDPHNR